MNFDPYNFLLKIWEPKARVATEINYEIHDRKLLAIMDALRSGVIYLKELKMKSLCILIVKISNIS
jgi:hypothetical protein